MSFGFGYGFPRKKKGVISTTFAPINFVSPSISGYPTDGQTLTVDYPGGWSGVPTSYTYQWYRDGNPISGATSST